MAALIAAQDHIQLRVSGRAARRCPATESRHYVSVQLIRRQGALRCARMRHAQRQDMFGEAGGCPGNAGQNKPTAVPVGDTETHSVSSLKRM